MAENKTAVRNPWLFVPTAYFTQGLPYVIINTFALVLLKDLGISNDGIAQLTTILALPWTLKPLWGPLVDGRSTKRNWVLYMQFIIPVLFLFAALALNFNFLFAVMLAFFLIAALSSATHDIALDGFYLHALDKGDQAFFTGIRSTFYRLAVLFGGGIMVQFAGDMGKATGNIEYGWSLALIVVSGVSFLLFIYHRFILPYPVTDGPVKATKKDIPFFESFKEYFKQDKILIILSFILLYRLGESLLVKMAVLFLKDPTFRGGLGVSTSEVGFMYGTMGVLALLAGGIIGGIMVKKVNLKKLLLPFALCMNIPHILYVYLAFVQPTDYTLLDLSFVADIFSSGSIYTIKVYPITLLCVMVEQFGYGLGFSGFMIYLLYISKGRYKTSHYAISTGFMALGMLLPGFISGNIQEWVGYQSYFIIALIASIPGVILVFFLPGVKNNLEDSD